jgi:glycosyltransferase involved in cell wall biosynthesis
MQESAMKFSLITVTMGDRPQLIARLKASLDAQTYRDFEWIVVDHKDHPEFKGGLSRARNFGIERATGDILGFPDDDAWYGPDLLESVSVTLADPENDGVSFRVVDEHGNCSAGGWMSAGKNCYKYSILRLFWALGVQSARAVQAVLQLRFKKAAYHIAMAAGRFAGCFTSKREMRNR